MNKPNDEPEEKGLPAASCSPPDDAMGYPCDDCGKPRSKNEGGTVFTVCDECWDKHFPTAND